jgi:N-acetylneuraminic acid mutarotase
MTASLAMATARLAVAGDPALELRWSQLPPLPDRLGVAGAFAGVSGGVLLVAGGANFPDRMPWDGGKKVWHDTIYALDRTNGNWRTVGKLPQPLAYGVSVTSQIGVVCVGGSDAEKHHAETFLLNYNGGEVRVKPLPALPVPLANASGALLGESVFVCAGAAEPGEQSALRRLFKLDLKSDQPGWQELPACPGEARILPVAGAAKGAFYLAGGAALRSLDGKVKRVYLRDAWRFVPEQGWLRLPDLPKPSVAAASPAPVVDSTLLLVGGDDGSLVGFQPVHEHPGFPRAVLALDLRAHQWRQLGETPAARATLPVVEWQGRFVLPSGEIRPGVRSPEVWTLSLSSHLP